MCPFLALPLLFLLLPCPALLNQPTGTRPPWAHTPPESSEAAPNQSPDPALVLPSSSKDSQDLNPRAARDVDPDPDPDPDPAQPPIKVLLTETCVQRDASAEGEGDGLTLDLEPGSPLVVTHRISLVPGPGACGGGCQALVATLQERMERLEREVSTLREKCRGTEGGCCTSQQSTGAHCTLQPEDMCPNDCSDQGRCDQGKCICFPGFSGPDCSSTTCPSNCNDRGTCVKGQCVCENGFTGSDCSGNSCPDNCNNKGQCVNGQCVCDSGFSGTDCSEKSCLNNCNNNGKCMDGSCVCSSGFTGPDCSEKSCPNNCSDNGRCVKSKCVCNSGFTGIDCSEKSCPNKCRNRGHCVDGQCLCNSGFTGPDCSEKSCPNNCSDNGRCVKSKCVCNSGFTGIDCSEKSCPNKCRNRGRCVDGQCLCDSGFTGPDCSEKSCPNNCSDNGRCVKSKCVCNSGFTGIDCSEKSCPNKCRNRGRCVDGQCLCDSGFTGPDCSEKSCPNNCSDNGRCVKSKCVCNSGFTGIDCSEKSCPNKCRSRGRCVDGQCLCDSGFTGPDCSEKSCPNNCSDNGRCVKSKCVCNSGFTGIDCSEKSCPNKCRSRGRCVDGQCLCDSGFTGPDCSEKSCPNNCNDNGRCVKSKCVCNTGFTGTDCSEKSCLNNCNNNGKCVDGSCVCTSGFTGTDCSDKSCPTNCSYRGRCVNGQCVCDSGFSGTDCSKKSCLNNCNNNGKCVDGSCVCSSGFTGPDCSEKSCPNNCSDNGRCVKSKCVCSSGFTGIDCSEKSCLNSCNNNGKCVDGSCVCTSGFTGTDCSDKSCPTNCSYRGRCVNGQCVCDSGFSGTDCSKKSCLNNCNNNGKCMDGSCVCSSGFTGPDCSEKSCPNNCSDNGRCVKSKCVCNSGFTGIDCSEKSCPNKCRSRGRCVDGQCLCDSGFTGPDCSEKSCPNNCSDNGRCVKSKCVCNSGFTGIDCSEKSCPNKCRSRGRCVDGQCLCDSGFTGPDCSEKSCPNNCSDNGRCVKSKCVCNSGFTGIDCSEKSCPNKCRSRGRCVDGQCLCDSGFTGPDCSEKSCPNNCSDNGRCVKSKCVCNSGFTGIDCSEKSCPNKCRSRGRCVDGQCLCDSGFTGPDCSEKSCPNNCNDNGRCVKSKCVCNSGFTGIDCSEKSCPNKCRNRGRCVDGQCLCNSGFTGPDCSEKSCPNNCNDNGRCVKSKCVCNSGFTGIDCSEKSCPNKCRNRGRCVDGQCLCNSGFTGIDCSAKSCPGNCSDQGSCEDGKCVCNSGFSGLDCSTKSCPNDCSNQGRCVDGKCVCEPGSSGQDCSTKSCPHDCTGQGRCVSGRCVCNHGFSGPDCTQCEEGFTGEDCSTALTGVSRLGSRDITDSSVTLFWTLPPVQYDAYLITFTSQKEGDPKITSKVDGRLTSYSQTGLAAGQEYSASVRGEKDGKMGTESTTEVTTLIPGPKNLRVVKTSTKSVDVQWEPPLANIDRYRLSIAASQSKGGEEPARREMTLPPERDSAHITGLEAGRVYDIALVSEKGRSQSQPITVEATPAAAPLPTEKAAILDTDVTVETATEAIGSEGDVAGKTNTTVFYKKTEEEDEHKAEGPKVWRGYSGRDGDSERTKVDLSPGRTGSTKPQDKGEHEARPKLPGRPILPKKNKIWGSQNFNHTRPVHGKVWQKQPGIKRPVFGGRRKIIHTAGPKPAIITDGAPSQTDKGKRPQEEINAPEVGTDRAINRGGNQTPSNQSQVGSESPAHPEMSTTFFTETGAAEPKTMTKGNIPNIIRKNNAMVGHRRVNDTIWMLRKVPGPGRDRGTGHREGEGEGDGAGVGTAGWLERGSPAVGSDTITTDIVGSDSLRNGGGDREPQGEPQTNGQEKMQLTQTQQSSKLPVLPTASSPPLLTASGLPENKQIGTPDYTGVAVPNRGSEPSLTPFRHAPGSKIPENQPESESQVHSMSPKDKGGPMGTTSRANNDASLHRTQKQHLVNLGPGKQGGSQETVSMTTNTGTSPDGTRDRDSRSQRLGDKGGSLETVSMATDSDTGPGETRDPYSGSPGPVEKEGSLETVSMMTDTGTGPDGTQDRHSGTERLEDKGGSLDTVSMTNKANMTHNSAIAKGGVDSSRDEGNNGVEGGRITVAGGHEGGPFRRRHPGLRKPPIRRPHIGPFRKRTKTETDRHSGSLGPGDKGGSQTIVSRTTGTDIGPDRTQEQHSGTQGLGDKGGSLETMSMKTDTGTEHDGTQDQNSGSLGPRDKGGSLMTVFRTTDTDIGPDRTREPHSGTERLEDKGGSLDTVSMTNKANMTSNSAITKGVVDSSSDEGNSEVEGGGITVARGHEGGPLRSGQPGFRKPPIRRPHIGPFRKRTKIDTDRHSGSLGPGDKGDSQTIVSRTTGTDIGPDRTQEQHSGTQGLGDKGGSLETMSMKTDTGTGHDRTRDGHSGSLGPGDEGGSLENVSRMIDTDIDPDGTQDRHSGSLRPGDKGDSQTIVSRTTGTDIGSDSTREQHSGTQGLGDKGGSLETMSMKTDTGTGHDGTQDQNSGSLGPRDKGGSLMTVFRTTDTDIGPDRTREPHSGTERLEDKGGSLDTVSMTNKANMTHNSAITKGVVDSSSDEGNSEVEGGGITVAGGHEGGPLRPRHPGFRKPPIRRPHIGPFRKRTKIDTDRHSGSLGPGDKGDSQTIVSRTTGTDIGSDSTREQHSGTQGLGDKGGSLETMSMKTDTGTGHDRTPDGHSGSLGPGDEGGSLENVSRMIDTDIDPDGTQDRHSGSLRTSPNGTDNQYSGSLRPKDKGSSLETVSTTTDTSTGLGGTQDKHSGSLGLGDKEVSLDTVTMTENSGTGSDGTQDPHSGKLGPGDNGGSLETVSMTTGSDSDGTRDQYSGSQKLEDKGGSLETNKAKVTHTTKGAIDSSSDKGNNGVEGGGITVAGGHEGGPLRSGHPGLRKPPIRRPHIGPFRNRTRPNLAASYHPSKGPYRRPGISNSLQRQQGGDSLGKTNSTGTRVSPSGQALATNSSNVKTRHSYYKIVRKITSIQADLHPNTSSTKRVGFRKVIVYTPVGLKSRANLGSSAPRTGPDFTSIGVENVTSSGFVLIWEVPPGIYQNFTVTRGEYGDEGTPERKTEEDRKEDEDEKEDEEVDEGRQNKVRVGSRQDDSRTGDVSRSEINFPAEPHEKTPKFSQVLPGSARSLLFRDLAPQANYSLTLSGTAPGLWSKIHQFTVATGPRPPSDLSFSGVTDNSVTVAWTKPKGPVSGYKVTYTHTNEGEPVSVEMDSQDSAVSLHELSPGSTYEVSVISLLGMDESDPIKDFVVTLPDPPSDLQANNVTHNTALLLWRPALATVDHYIIVYGSEQGVSTVVSGDVTELPLTGLQSSTQYTVTISSQSDGHRSTGASTIFTTAGVPDPPSDLQAINVTHNTALLLWRPALATVDHYIIVYGSEQGVSTVVSGDVTELPLTGLQSSTQYTVTISSQSDGHRSTGASTIFTTAGGPDESRQKGPRKLTASNVTPRSAVLSWKPPPVAVAGYKLTYQTAGREAKEVTLDPSTTQYKLSRLHPRSKYTVHLQGERQGEYTSATSTKFTTEVLRYPFPSDCSQELLNGMQDSGEAEIFPGGQRGRAVPIFCDMETDGGGWTVFQRRVDGDTNFFRTWSEYSRGFGNLSRDFWLGNDLLHSLTSVLPMAMRVDLRVGAESTYAHYASFAVDTEKRYYALALSGYSGTAGDSMAYHNLSRFSTWDRDSNPYVTRCAMSYRGGWWYRNCHEANLNGLYDTHTNHQGVIWTSWKGTDFSIPFSEMKIRPASFTPPSQG